MLTVGGGRVGSRQRARGRSGTTGEEEGGEAFGGAMAVGEELSARCERRLEREIGHGERGNLPLRSPEQTPDQPSREGLGLGGGSIS